ncbi:MAG: hypothetical protein NC311_05875 [Muribaculaceae bacterium]|nr:hypothetical protein [Muribaculaceae bacterium]
MPEMQTYVELAREPGNPHHTTVVDVPIPGWAPLADAAKEKFDACNGYCSLTVVDDVITDVTPDENTPEVFYATIREKEAAIAEAKAKLTEGDYKVIKAYEAAILGQPAPYDMATEIQERDALRAAVNDAEDAIADARTKIDEFFTAANANRTAYK